MEEMESLELREKLEVAMKRLGEVLADDAAICAALADVWKVFRYVVEHESFGAVSKTLMDSAQKSIEAAVAEGSGSQYVRRSELEKVQAEAAAMREALKLAAEAITEGYGWHDEDEEGCLEDDTCGCTLVRSVNAALSSTAGKDLLERHAKEIQEAVEKERKEIWYELKAALPVGDAQRALNRVVDERRARGAKRGD